MLCQKNEHLFYYQKTSIFFAIKKPPQLEAILEKGPNGEYVELIYGLKKWFIKNEFSFNLK